MLCLAFSPPTLSPAHSDHLRTGCFHEDRKDTSRSPAGEVSPSFAQQVFILPERDDNIDPALRTGSTSSSAEKALTDNAEPHISPDRTSTERDTSDVVGVSNNEGLNEVVDDNQSVPGLDELLREMDDDQSVSDFINLDPGNEDYMPEPFDLPYFMGDVLNHAVDIEDIPRVPATTLDYDAWALRLASRPLSTGNGTTKSTSRGISGPFTYLYEQPSLPQTSPEMLALRFDRLTCGILSVMVSLL